MTVRLKADTTDDGPLNGGREDDSGTVRLPPPLKLRRTAVALAQAVSRTGILSASEQEQSGPGENRDGDVERGEYGDDGVNAAEV
jgi:hypothetical protein